MMPPVGPVEVFRTYGGGRLGDAWVSVAYLMRLSERRQTTVTVSSIDKYGRDKRPMLREIIDVFDAGNRIHITRRRPTHELDARVWSLGARPIPGLQWQPATTSKTICFQLDGVSNASRKNPPERDLPRLVNFVPEYEFIRLGQPLTIREIVRSLARCHLFFGVCSGISFIAHSVGAPTFLVRYKNDLTPWHQNKTYVPCNGTEELIAKVRHHVASYKK
jgi:hypothetical protein